MIKLRYIEEPSLQFGTNQHICPKSGIFSYNPFDINQVRPEKITIGIIGKGESIDKVLEWMESCKTHIEGKQSKNPHHNLFLNFCGFSKNIGFQSEVVYDESYKRRLNNSDFDKIIKKESDLEKRISEIAALFFGEIKYLTKNKKPDVILCALTENFISYIQKAKVEEDEEAEIVDEVGLKELPDKEQIGRASCRERL